MNNEKTTTYSVEQYEGTPFNIVTISENEEKNYAISIGQHIVFKAETREECEKAIDGHNWNLTISVIGAMKYIMNEYEKYNKEKQDNNEN